MTQPVRLQKFLSQAGIASRRAAEELIRAGRVRVNGVVITEMGVKVAPERDRVEIDGKRVRSAVRVWLAVHKPVGVMSTRSDPEGRRTIYDLLPPRYRQLFYVGRLDLNSEGLMLLTNDGDAAQLLLHPRHQVEREYEVVVAGRLSPGERKRLLQGVVLEDGPAKAAAVRVLGRATAEGTRLRIALREGRKHEVRRMLQAVGHRVRQLVRVRYGPIELGNLAPGEFRRLSESEIARIDTGDAGAH